MKNFRRALAALLVLALASVANAQATVRYTLAAYQPGTTTPVQTVKVGSTFDLAISVQDLRPPGTWTYKGAQEAKIRGVFAAYCDVLYVGSGMNLTGNAVPPERNFTFAPLYQNGTNVELLPNRLHDLGSFFAGDWTQGAGTDPVEVVRWNMTAKAAGNYQVRMVFGSVSPWCNTLVFGNKGADPPEESYVAPQQITTSQPTLKIVP